MLKLKRPGSFKMVAHFLYFDGHSACRKCVTCVNVRLMYRLVRQQNEFTL